MFMFTTNTGLKYLSFCVQCITWKPDWIIQMRKCVTVQKADISSSLYTLFDLGVFQN